MTFIFGIGKHNGPRYGIAKDTATLEEIKWFLSRNVRESLVEQFLEELEGGQFIQIYNGFGEYAQMERV